MSKAANFIRLMEDNEEDWVSDFKRTYDVLSYGKVIKRFQADSKYSPQHIKDVLVKKYNFDPDIELKIHLDGPPVITRRERETWVGGR